MSVPAVLSLLLLITMPVGLYGQAAPEDNTPAPIRFRRVLAPEDRIQDWPLSDGKYLPIDTEEFDTLTAAAQSASTVALGSTHYIARLVDDQLLGKATVDVILVGPSPAVLPLEPCNLALGKVAYLSQNVAQPGAAVPQAIQPPVLLGLGGNGKIQAIVEHSGQLQFDWSLAGRRDTNDILDFLCKIPSGPSARWLLDLPEGFTPSVDHGVVVDSEPVDKNVRRWHIELGGNRRFHLRILPTAETGHRARLVLLRESRVYDLSLRGVEVSSQWRLQVHHEPLRQITMRLDPGLQLVSARCGEDSVPWSIAVPPADGEATRVVLTLPKPIYGAEQMIRLSALGRVTLDRPWRLPRVWAEDLFWQEGTMTLLTPDPLTVERIVPIGCRQTATSPLSAPRIGESMQFQAFDPDATVEVLLSQRPAPSTTQSTLAKPNHPQHSEGSSSDSDDILRSAQDDRNTNTTRPVLGSESGPSAPSEPSVWAWRCDLESRYQADGTALHQATYDLQCSAHTSIHLTMPSEVAAADIRSIWIDGKPLVWQSTESEGKLCIAMELPPDRKFLRVTLQWTTSGSPLGVIGSLRPPLPKPDLPVLVCHWTVWLPPGYDFPTSSSGEFPAIAEDLQNRSGWQMNISSGSPPTLRFIHRPSMQLFGTITFLLVVALGCWKALDRPKLLAWFAGGLLLTGLVLPDAYLPLALGGMFGFLFCLVWRWCRPVPVEPSLAASRPTKPPQEQPSDAIHLDSTVTKIIQLGAILLALSVMLTDDIARSETPTDASPIYRVLTPIDAEKKPSGNKVYVPEELYQKLHRRASSMGKPQGWLILRATYKAHLAVEAGSGRLGVDTLQALYDLEVFGRFTRVEIPLRAEGANRSPENVLLDGRSIPSTWDPTAAALVFEVTEPGQYRLEVTLHPSPQSNGSRNHSGWFNMYGFQNIAQQLVNPFRLREPIPLYSLTGFDVTIPRVPRSQLELALPEDAPAIEVPSTRGAVRLEKSPPRLIADLGPADHLTVRWHEGPAADEVSPVVDAEQFLWLKIQPGSLVLIAKFHLRVAEGQIQQVQLAVDPRLRLLPLAGDDPPTVHIGQESGQSRLITFRLPRPVSDKVVLEATFLLSDAMGVGNFRLPRLELRDARSAKRWMAVSVAPTLDHEQQNKEGLKPISVDDFLKAWKGENQVANGQWPVAGETTLDSSNTPSSITDPLSTPQIAYRLPSGEIDWSISTRPREPRTTADQILSLRCDRDHVDLLFEAQLSTTSGYLFQYRLAAPKDWKIKKVSLLEGNIERVSRWSRDADGTVTVFLNDAASGQQKLMLYGRLPIEPGRAWSPPRVSLEHCDVRLSIMRLYRRPTVRLTIDGVQPPDKPAPPRDPSDRFDLGHFVAEFPSNPLQTLSVTIDPEPDRLPLGRGRHHASPPKSDR